MHDLPVSVNDRVISPFRKCFLFTKLRICKVLRKLNPRENFRIYSIKHYCFFLTEVNQNETEGQADGGYIYVKGDRQILQGLRRPTQARPLQEV